MSGIVGKNAGRDSGIVGTTPVTADSITGDEIADDAIDSEHYTGASIDTVAIATNQIDETLMKDAFVGDFTDATVTASDYFLHGDATDSGNTKKDTVQGILDLAGGGAWKLLTSRTASTSATVDFLTSFSSSYDSYCIIISNVEPDVDDKYLSMQYAIGGSAVAANYSYACIGYDDAGNENRFNSGSDSEIRLHNGTGTATGENMNGVVWIHGTNGTTNYKGCSFQTINYTNIPESGTQIGGGTYEGATTALTGVRFLMSANNILSGNFDLYGVANS